MIATTMLICFVMSCWVSALPEYTIKTKANGLPDAKNGKLFTQKLDHFHISNTETWGQTYYMNDDYYKGYSLVYLIVGGPDKVNVLDIQSEMWIQYAKEADALVVCLEHRYYGDSRPTKDLSIENLEYLNTEQALADLAWFIDSMKRQYPKGLPSTAKWVALGANYGGTLAARLRSRFPNVIYAAVSWSSPLLEKTNFSEYFKFVEDNLEEAVKVEIKKAYKLIEEAFKDDERRTELKQKFKSCDNNKDANNEIQNEKFLYWTIANLLGIVVKYSYYDELQAKKKEVMEKIVDNSKPDALERLASAINFIIENHLGESCVLTNYNEVLKKYQKTLWDTDISSELISGFGNRPYLYQHCTEFGQFETSDEENSLFGHYIPLDFYINICEAAFGKFFNLKSLEKGVARTYKFYGGLDIEVSRVIYVNGDHDPLAKLSITETKCSDRIAVYVKENNADVGSENEYSELLKAHKEIVSTLAQWLSSKKKKFVIDMY